MPFAQGAKPAGAATPQEAVAVLQKASTSGDMLQSLAVISPNGLKQIANEGVTGMVMVLAFADPDDPMPGGPKPTKTELDKKKKDYAAPIPLVPTTSSTPTAPRGTKPVDSLKTALDEFFQ